VTEVKIREHESIDEALRRFKRECERAGLMTEIKRREYYESPSVRKKRKIAEAKRKQKRKEVKFLSRLKRKR
jgi:small subunit ribosomal protein S21